ncbi:MAG: response regulator [Phototrophicaceae bacterium]
MTARILCVEDNPQNMRLVRKLLRRDYTVLEAEDGLTGLKMAEDELPDLILMDINLPDMSGLEVTKRIKAQDHLRHIPIIALTAHTIAGDEDTYIDAGCDGYIVKPVDKIILYAEIERFIAKPEEEN